MINGREIFYSPPIVPPDENEFPEDDKMWCDFVLEKVTKEGESFGITFSDGLFLSIPFEGNVIPFEPKVGDHCRLYGDGFGFVVRGVFINGKKFHYQTELEFKLEREKMLKELDLKKEDEWQENKNSLMERVSQLPDCFQSRINRFMKENSNFGKDYLSYELMVCEQAVLLADCLFIPYVNKMGIDALPSYYESVCKWSFEEFVNKVAGLDEGHSGNSFFCALNLAYAFSMSKNNYVIESHGAMAPLVGCESYGCKH